MFDRITFETKIMGGRACIRGMRIPVSVVVGQIAHGAAWDEVLQGYPDLERETAIIRTRVPEIDAALADQVARVVRTIRSLDLKKHPSISETLDWARTLVLLQVQRVDAHTTKETLPLLLKYQQDIEKASAELAGRAD